MDTNETQAQVVLQKLNDEILPYMLPSVALGSVLLVTGITGNVLVLYNYLLFTKASSHYFIVALSCYDLLRCTVVLPTNIYFNLNQLNMSSVLLCKTHMMLAHTAFFGSVFILIAIVVDRYLKIYHPFYRMSHSRVKLFCLLTSVVSALYSLPAVVVIFGIGRPQTRIPGLKGYACYESSHSKTTFAKVYSRSLGVLFLTVLAILLFAYFQIWRYFRLRRRAALGISIDKVTLRKLTDVYNWQMQAKKKTQPAARLGP